MRSREVRNGARSVQLSAAGGGCRICLRVTASFEARKIRADTRFEWFEPRAGNAPASQPLERQQCGGSVMDFIASSLQVAQTSIQLLAFACNFYDTHHRIDKTECGLKEELEILLQLCKEVDTFLTRHYHHPAGSNVSSDQPKLLCLALKSLNREVEVYNEQVQKQLNPAPSMQRVLRLMWHRPDWSETMARMTSRKMSLGLAFHMITIDIAQAERLETRVAYQEVSARMTSLKKRHQFSQAAKTSHSRHRETLAAEKEDNTEFLTLAQRVYDDITHAVSPAASKMGRPSSPDKTSSPPVSVSARARHRSVSMTREESTPGGSANTKVQQETGHVLSNVRHDDLHSKSTLTAAVEHDLAAARNILRDLEAEREPDGRLSRKGLTELEQAREHQDAALRRSALLKSKFNISPSLEKHVEMLEDLSRINELSGRPVDAANNLVDILSCDLDEDLAIKIKLKITELYVQAGRLEEALVLIHKTYDSARSLWQYRREGIPEVIACLTIMAQLHQDNPTIAVVLQKEAALFKAWEYIQRNSHPDFSKHLREYGDSPLAYAASRNLVTDVQYLLNSNIELLKHSSAAGATPLFAATHEKHEDVVRAILDANRRLEAIDINEVDSHGDSALHAAQMPPSLGFDELHPNESWRSVANSITVLLLGAGANIDLTNNLGQSALHIAAEQGNCEVVRTLLARSPQLLNAQDASMSTPLHIAIERGRFELVEWLVNQNADTTMQDDQGRDALELAKDPILHDLRNNEVINILKNEQRERHRREGRSISTVGRQSTIGRIKNRLCHRDVTR